MKSAIAFCTLFVATAFAAPLEARHAQQVTVALSNDQSGAYAGVTLAADHTDQSISTLFGSTSVGTSGQVLASSIQLTQFPQSINCVLKNNGVAITTLTPQQTFFDLDGNPHAATPINLSGAVINCHA